MKLKDILESKNIAENLDEDTLKEIGAEVVQDYNTDKSSRIEWEKKNKEANELALQISKDKTTPWPNAANIKFPLLTIAALQFQSRVYPALVKAPDLVKFRSQGSDSEGTKAARAQRVSSHMSYQMLEKDEHWEEQMDKAYFVLPIAGCVFKKTYRDPVRDLNCSECVLPQDLVVHYYAKSIEDAERKTHVLQMSERKIKERVLRGVFLEHTLSAPGVKPRTQADERQGTSPPVQDSDRPREILEQHRFLDLDGDGYKEPYIVTVDYETESVFRIEHRFGEIISEQSLKVKQKRESLLDLAQNLPSPEVLQAQGGATPEQVQAIQAAEATSQRLQAEIQALQAEDPDVLRIQPVEYFTKIPLIPSPDGGIYDIGFGSLLSPLNHSVNTIINQLVDSGTLQTSNSGFIGRGARLKGGKLRFSPNEWKKVDVPGATLKDSLVPLPVNAPSPVLFQLLGLLINYTERVSSVTDLMSGENPGQNTPAYNMSAMLEQGMQVFNGIFKRVYRAFRSEIRKMYSLNARYLSAVEYFEYQDTTQQVYREDYQSDPQDIIPAADPNAFASKEKQAKAQIIAERAMVVPGYDPIKVEQAFLESMDVPNSAELFPVQQQEDGSLGLVFAPGPDPEFEIKRMEEERRTLEAQDRAKIQYMEAEGKLALIEAQILKLTAEAEVQADSIELERLKILQSDMQDRRKTLLEMAKIEDAHEERRVQRVDSESNN